MIHKGSVFRLNSRYGISGTPTIILWVDGVALARMDEAPFSVKAFKDFIQRWTDLEYASNFRLDVNSIPGPLSSKLDLYWIIMFVLKNFFKILKKLINYL